MTSGRLSIRGLVLVRGEWSGVPRVIRRKSHGLSAKRPQRQYPARINKTGKNAVTKETNKQTNKQTKTVRKEI